MATVEKISSNITGLRFAEEAKIRELPTSPAPIWWPFEPNSYDDFGGDYTRIARNPINDGRQRKKGNVVDLDASGGFESDLTQSNMQEILQGFMFADLRRKAEMNVSSVTGGAYVVSGTGTQFEAGDLLFAKMFPNSANNGLKLVTASASGSVTVAGLVNGAGTGIISRVGFQFASGDLEIDTSGPFPRLLSSAKDLTDFGLIPGEFIYVGGDDAATSFDDDENSGFMRVKSVAAGEMVIDKSNKVLLADDGAGKTIRIFIGRALKNERGSLIKRRTYQLERTLGAKDTAFPNQVQAEYVVGAVPGEWELTLNTADKATVNLSFMGTSHEIRTGAEGVKDGTRPAIIEADMFNTSSDIKRIRMAKVVDGNEAPTPLFGFLTELSLTINNNLEANKALGFLGSFDITEGTFQVDASCTAYFSDIEAIKAVRDNSDVTLDCHLVANNAGISIDIPMVGLGEGRADVQQDQAITLPLAIEAGTGAKYDPNMDHTLMMVFFDYLPNAADA